MLIRPIRQCGLINRNCHRKSRKGARSAHSLIVCQGCGLVRVLSAPRPLWACQGWQLRPPLHVPVKQRQLLSQRISASLLVGTLTKACPFRIVPLPLRVPLTHDYQCKVSCCPFLILQRYFRANCLWRHRCWRMWSNHVAMHALAIRQVLQCLALGFEPCPNPHCAFVR